MAELVIRLTIDDMLKAEDIDAWCTKRVAQLSIASRTKAEKSTLEFRPYGSLLVTYQELYDDLCEAMGREPAIDFQFERLLEYSAGTLKSKAEIDDWYKDAVVDLIRLGATLREKGGEEKFNEFLGAHKYIIFAMNHLGDIKKDIYGLVSPKELPEIVLYIETKCIVTKGLDDLTFLTSISPN